MLASVDLTHCVFGVGAVVPFTSVLGKGGGVSRREGWKVPQFVQTLVASRPEGSPTMIGVLDWTPNKPQKPFTQNDRSGSCTRAKLDLDLFSLESMGAISQSI